MKRPAQPRRPLLLHPLGPVEPALLAWLARQLDDRFPVRSHLGEPWRLRAEWLSLERGQYRSNDIVDALVSTEPEGWVLAVTEADLFAPERRFVFGEATLGGCCALISLARLRGGAGDQSGDESTQGLRHRLLVEAVHELGHVAGLAHCDTDACVMTPAEQAADIDAKTPEFCARCRGELIVGSW